MTSKKLLEMMMVVYARLSAEEKKNADYYLENFAKDIMTNSLKDSTISLCLGFTVGEIIRVLKQDIYNSENKKNGKSKQATAIKSVINVSKQNNGQPQLLTSYLIDGKQYVMCYAYGFVFNDPIEGVPVSNNLEHGKKFVDIINTAKHNTYDIELELPERNALSVYIKTEKAYRKTMGKYAQKNPITFDFGGDYPLVNAEYLLAVMDGLPDGKLLFCSEHPYSPMYCKGSDGEALLIPVEKRTENTCRTEI